MNESDPFYSRFSWDDFSVGGIIIQCWENIIYHSWDCDLNKVIHESVLGEDRYYLFSTVVCVYVYLYTVFIFMMRCEWVMIT